MATDTTPTLRELFEAALAIESADERTRWLDAHCDARLRGRVERMLAFARDDAAPGPPAAEVAAALAEGAAIWTPPASMHVGAFELGATIGEGGSSTVFRATRLVDGVRQDVALKLLHRNVHSPEAQRQYRRELQALSQLCHPGIARLIDGGVTEIGTAYLALELVDGLPIVEFSRRHRLDLRARLALFLDVARIVEAAHRALIVHRDLKPSNVLVDADGHPRLLDFGVAKLLAADDETQTQLAAFTPAYAAPEQRSGEAITTATDVYALGVMLGELMTGERLGDGDPRTPSGSVSEQAAAGVLPAPAATTRRLLKGDLDNIVLKALHRDPAERYASAGRFADEIERLLGGQPVSAHPPSNWYRARKFVARHKGGVATTMAFLLAIFAALGIALWQGKIAREQARLAQQQSRRAQAVQDFLIDVFNANTNEQPDQAKARNTTAQELLARGARKIETSLDDAPDAKTQLLHELAYMHFDLGLDEDAVHLFREAVDNAHRAHGAHAVEAFESELGLANALHSSDDEAAEKAVLDETAASLDANHDNDAARRGRLYGEYAGYYVTRDAALALDYGRRAVTLLDPLPQTRELDLPAVLALKGRAEGQSGLDADAIASYQRAIAMSRSLRGDDSAESVRFHAEVAQLESRRGDIAQAEHDGREALRIARAIHGENHIDVVQSEFRLADTLAVSGRMPEALDLYADAKRKVLALVGPDDGFHTPAVLSSYALALIRAGRIEEGLANIDAAIANRRRNRPGTVPLADYLETAALGRIETGDFALAQGELDEARAIHEKAGLKLPNAKVQSLLRTRAQLALAQGDITDATRTIEALPAEVATPLTSANLRATLLRAEIALAADHTAQAQTIAANVRARIEASDTRDYLRPFSAWSNFIEGEADVRNGDAHAAVAHLNDALAAWRGDLDGASPRIALADLALARAQLALGNRAAAVAAVDAAAGIERRQPRLGAQYREALESVRTQLAQMR
jgi:serine/threonine-protein kinase